MQPFRSKNATLPARLSSTNSPVYTLTMPRETISISSRHSKQVLDITEKIEQIVARTGIADGLCNVFVSHTTAGITTGESIEGTDEDLMETLEKIIPKIRFRHA